MVQAEGLRVISFRHEQHAGNAAAAAGFLTSKPGICLTVSAPGFLNGLTALANATTNCFPMILISGSSEREIVDLQQGDYEEMDQLAIAKPLCKAAYRVLHAEDIGIGIARAIRAALSGRPGGVYLDLPAKLFAQTMDAAAGRRSLVKVVDPAPRQMPAPDAVERALDLLKGAKRPLIVLGKGAAYAQADADIRALIEKTGIPYLPMSMAKGLLPDTHAQSASATRSFVLAEADVVMLIGARLNWLLSHGKGKTWGGANAEPSAASSRSTSRRPRSTATCRSPRRWSATSAPACRRCSPASVPAGPSRRPNGPARSPSARTRTWRRWPQTLAKTPVADELPERAQRDPRAWSRRSPDAIVVNEGANTLDFARSIVDMYEPRKRLDVGTWGIMGIGMGFAVAAAVTTGKPVIAIEGDSAFGFSRHGGRDDLPLRPAGVRGRLQQQRRLQGHRRQPARRRRRADGVRQGRALRQDDRGLRRRRRPCDHRRRAAGRASPRRSPPGKPTLINAVIDETAGTESGRITEPQPAERGEEEVTRAGPRTHQETDE